MFRTPTRSRLRRRAGAAAIVGALLLTGCTKDETPPAADAPAAISGGPSAGPAASATPTPARVAPPIKPPRPAPGELGRAVAAGNKVDSTFERPAVAGRDYRIQVSCRSVRRTDRMSYVVRTESGTQVASGDIGCDGTKLANVLGSVPAERLRVELDGVGNGVTGYALVTPA